MTNENKTDVERGAAEDAAAAPVTDTEVEASQRPPSQGPTTPSGSPAAHRADEDPDTGPPAG